MDDRLEGYGRLPWREIDGAAGQSCRQYGVSFGELSADLDPLVGTHFEISAPPVPHGFRRLHAVAQRLDEDVVAGHERSEAIHVVSVDCGNELFEGFDGMIGH